MSTDLDHRHQQQQSSIKIEAQAAAEEEITKTKGALVLLRNITDELDVVTPTEDENKIPVTLTPPPAPRKPAIKRRGVACKRKLFGELHVVSNRQIHVKEDEVDAFFKSSFEALAAGKNSKSAAMTVKRCKCT